MCAMCRSESETLPIQSPAVSNLWNKLFGISRGSRVCPSTLDQFFQIHFKGLGNKIKKKNPYFVKA